ncbi:Uncharacterized protein Adt_14390 [Abeliophyllum distichum]|uniref:Ubiquitin-like domain-containing protein n=1 Tax=Abeliophyllum distichum TaxID=126358 RepID=A0ABD1TZI1_9LAMI
MRFSFVYFGWEGTANDLRVFVDTGDETLEQLFNAMGRQRQIPTECCAIRNFIRQEHDLDTLFAEYSVENIVFQDILESSQDQEAIHFDASQTAQMGQVRDEIATQMWNDYSRSRT